MRKRKEMLREHYEDMKELCSKIEGLAKEIEEITHIFNINHPYPWEIYPRRMADMPLSIFKKADSIRSQVRRNKSKLGNFIPVKDLDNEIKK